MTRPYWCGSRACGRPRALVDHAEHLLPGPGAKRHLHVLAAVLGSGRAPLRQCGSLAALIAHKFYLPSLKIEGRYRLGAPDLEHLLLPPAESNRVTKARCTTSVSTRRSYSSRPRH